jgi:hypothetical protein
MAKDDSLLPRKSPRTEIDAFLRQVASMPGVRAGAAGKTLPLLQQLKGE